MNDDLPRVIGRPPRLTLCYGCGYHVLWGTERCPHCGADVQALIRNRLKEIEAAKAAIARVIAALSSGDDPDDAPIPLATE
jgi:hypothetical protein